MKRWVKNTLITIGCLSPVALVSALSVSWVKDIPISIVGSSGVLPFSQAFGDLYHSLNNEIDITVEAGGSGFGIEQVAKGFTEIGNASKDPYSAILGNGQNNWKTEWQDKNIKTVTIGYEAICVVFNPGKELAQKLGDKINQALYVSKENIGMFYSSFSGHYNQYLTSAPTFKPFVNPSIASKSELEKIELLPYVRTGGATTSGTASSFYDRNHFADFEKELTEEQQAAFKYGNYGSDFEIKQTAEENSRAYKIFESDNKVGSIVYLSSGFVNANRDLIKKQGYGIMSYKKDATITEFSVENINQGYEWFRPLNSLVHVPKGIDFLNIETYTPAMRFIQWLLFGVEVESSKLWNKDAFDHQINSKGLWKSIGGRLLPWESIRHMMLNNGSGTTEDFLTQFWASDYEIMEHDSKIWEKTWGFGAYEGRS